MLRLDSTLRKLQLQLAGAVATLQLPVLVSYSDKTATTYNGGTQVSNSNSATLVDICAAPAAATIRDIDAILIWNRDTAAATIKIVFNDNGTAYQLTAVTLAIGDQFVFTHAEGWRVLDATGGVKSIGPTYIGTANEITVNGLVIGLAATLALTGKAVNVATQAQGNNTTLAASTAFVQAETNLHKNVIINGGFDVWQRGTSLGAATGLRYLADRWHSQGTGSSVGVGRLAFTLGQTTVPGEPAAAHECVVTSVANAANGSFLSQKIEGVRTFAGQTATLSFWAKADAAKNIAVEFAQVFGSGGGSAAVTSIGVTTCALTTSWQKFTITVAIPSIAGKTIGTGADDCLQVLFWLDAGSSWNARTNSLGQQSGTFDFAQMQFEAGSVATNFEYQSFGDTLQRCLRYYQKSFPYATVPAQNCGTYSGGATIRVTTGGVATSSVFIPLSPPMRAAPTPVYYNPLAANGNWKNTTGTDSGVAITSNNGEKAIHITDNQVAGDALTNILVVHWSCDTEL